jgi:NTE family protein
MTEESKKIALCLGGGGITGAMYQVGVLAALEDAFEPFQTTDFDIFVAAGSGAPVALGLAGGIGARRMYRAFLNPADDLFALRRQHLLQLDGKELKRVASSIAGSVRRMAGNYLTRPLETDLWNELDRFWDSLPAGIFSAEPFERFLTDFMVRRGIEERFQGLRRALYLVAVDLDEGGCAIFGPGYIEDIPVARAVTASCAVPMLYAPIRHADRDYIAMGASEATSLDIAAASGARTVVVINAAVPVRNDPAVATVPTGRGPRRRVRDKGLLWVQSQSYRLEVAQRLSKGIEAMRASHPEVQVHLLEPARDSAALFLHSPMNFAARRAILVEAYTATRAELARANSPLRLALEAEGLSHRAPNGG